MDLTFQPGDIYSPWDLGYRCIFWDKCSCSLGDVRRAGGHLERVYKVACRVALMTLRSACLGCRPYRATDSLSLGVTCQESCSEEQALLLCKEAGEPSREMSRRGSLEVTSLFGEVFTFKYLPVGPTH